MVPRLATVRSFLAAFVLAVAVAPIQAQVVAADPRAAVDAQGVHLDRLCVKLAEGSGAEWREGRLVSRTGTDLRSVARWFSLAAPEPLVGTLAWDELDRLHRNACAVLPEGRRPGHMGLWFRLRTETPQRALELRAALADEPLVVDVYLEPRFALASATPTPGPGGDLPPTTPSFTSMQGAHQPPPVGHDLRRAAGTYGARGQGARVYMMESSWVFGHEDVSKIATSSFLGPVPAYEASTSQHGLSGASILLADRNAYGVTGVVDEVDVRFVALELNGGLEASILSAVADGQPGDVILVVIMALVPGYGPGSWLPFEFYQSTFDATLTATANGLHVVVPAGNGNRSLDDPTLLNRFDRSFRDSGAIIVAGSAAGALQRASYSNWGTRIDANGWGDNVVSCGYGTLFYPNSDLLQSYTAAATGTSSATPHVAGIIAMLQGAAKHQLGQRLTNAQVQQVLHSHGPTTPDVIGRRCDVVEAFTVLGIVDGLRVDVPDVDLVGTVTATMDGPAGSVAALFGAFAPGDFAVGFNRNLHLDPFGIVAIGGFLLPNGTASWSLTIPNDPLLHGTDLYLQAVRLVGSNPLFLTSSCQVTIL